MQFGQYRLRREERLVVGPGGPIELSGRAFDILCLFLGKPGEVLSKDEIFAAVWPGVVVEENTLQVHISTLRKALDPSMVVTVHGRGYKYAGPQPVTMQEAPTRGNLDRPASIQTDMMSKPSVAVLPFDNLSGDPEQGYFSDGITEDIITELSRFHSLLVISRHSSFAFRGKQLRAQEIGLELGVDYIVEGTVRRLEDRLRLTAQLIQSGSDNHIWAERYDRDVHDIFKVQDELAHAIAATIGAKVEAVRRERATRLDPDALKAHDLVLRANAFAYRFTRSDVNQARKLAWNAAELDPDSSQAHACYAYCCSIIAYSNWDSDCNQVRADSFRSAKQAIALDATDNYARWVLGFVYLTLREFEEARIHLEKALGSNPNDTEARGVYAIFLVAFGDAEAAIQHFGIIRRLNPFDLSWFPWIEGWALFSAHRYEEAISTFKQIPEPHNEVRGILAASYAYLGKLVEANASIREFLRIAERDMPVFPGHRLGDWNEYWRNTTFYKRQEDHDHLIEGLRRAGLPE